MPTSSDPRWMVRFSAEGGAVVAAAAASAGVSVGGLIRECAERHAVDVAREIRAGRIRVRKAAADAAVDRVRAIEGGSSVVERPVVPESGAERAAAFRLMTARRAR